MLVLRRRVRQSRAAQNVVWFDFESRLHSHEVEARGEEEDPGDHFGVGVGRVRGSDALVEGVLVVRDSFAHAEDTAGDVDRSFERGFKVCNEACACRIAEDRRRVDLEDFDLLEDAAYRVRLGRTRRCREAFSVMGADGNRGLTERLSTDIATPPNICRMLLMLRSVPRAPSSTTWYWSILLLMVSRTWSFARALV